MLVPIVLPLLLMFASQANAMDDDLERDLLAARDRLGPVMDDPAAHRVQVIYSRVVRDNAGELTLYRRQYRVDPEEYFYPASTVKFPIAVAALELLEELGVSGLDRDTAMLTDSARPAQSSAHTDPTAASGLPSVGHYVRKLSIVSDNDASNRLFELLGTDDLHARLARWGMPASRITHRLALRLPAEENRHFNPVRFVDGDEAIYSVPARTGEDVARDVAPILLGEGEYVGGEFVPGPKNFARTNHMPLAELHGLLENIMHPELVPDHMRPRIADADRELLLEAMQVMPSESGIAAYRDPERYSDGFANYFIMGREPDGLPEGVTITNKVGRAYGFLTETAHVHDAVHDVTFMLTATVYVNANGIFNDDVYDYETLGFPFLRELGRLMLAYTRASAGSAPSSEVPATPEDGPARPAAIVQPVGDQAGSAPAQP